MSRQAIWIKGALLLTIAGFISKVLGMIYRVPLQNMAGDEGLYIYQQVYPILSIAILLSVYSIPGALSHTLKDKDQQIDARLPNTWAVFYWLFGLGFIIFLGIWLSSDFLASVMGDASLAPSIKAASLMFLIIPFTALFRGFFQSVHLTEYVAISQVVEQMVRVFGIIIVTIVAVNHLPIYSIGVLTSIATIIGAVIAGLWLTLMFRRKKTAYKLSKHQKLKGTFVQSLLIGIAVYSISYVLHLVLQVVDVFSLVDLLRKYGLAFEEAKIAKGVFDRSHSMVQLGLVIGSSLALALIPALNKDLNQQLLALKWTFLLSLSASLGLVAVMPNLNPLLFITRGGTYSIQLMMGLVFLLSMTIVISVFLQEYNYRIQQLKWVLMMIIIKWCLNILLIPQFGLVGSSIAYLVAVSFLLLVFVVKWKQLTKVNIPFKFFIKTLLLSVIMLGAVWSINQWLIVDRLVLIPIVLAQCVLGILIILIGLYVFKIFSKNEWMALVGHRFERRS